MPSSSGDVRGKVKLGQARLVRAEHAEERHLDRRGLFGPLRETDLQAKIVDFVGPEDVRVRDERPVQAAYPDRRDGRCPSASAPAGRGNRLVGFFDDAQLAAGPTRADGRCSAMSPGRWTAAI